MKHGMGAPRIGQLEVERLVCGAEAFGAIEEIQPRDHNAWQLAFPSLASLPPGDLPEKKLRICIATEEIVGPVRNGGIGTTYAYLAEMLASIGYDTTVLFLRGRDVENGTVEDWVAYYGERGVKFIPVPNYAAADKFQTGADRWLKAPYNMLRWLMENPMDVVHVSEWHGCGYLSLLAKRQSLAFQRTLFIVKTSSPWLWNRLYGAQPVERLEDLAKITAERQSVELADMVIGGSLHLLRWMASQGYRIPHDRTFVQPNLVKFDHLRALTSLRSFPPGTRLPVEEIVFFGRLEARKGLFVFCQAIKRLIRLGVALPKVITFMGKPGARLTARPDQDILDYIESESKDWPCQIQVLTNFQQYEALEYLLTGARLAIMPSIIENSTMAVYETAICGIPFIASAAGGTPELIAPEDQELVLCEAHPFPLAEKIAEALAHGAYVARPSFSNDDNLGVWEKFHRDLGRGLLQELLSRSAPAPTESGDATFSVCVYHSGDDAALRTTLDSLRAQEHSPLEVIVAVDADDFAAADRTREMLRHFDFEGSVVEAFDFDVGLACNTAAQAARGEFVLFMVAGVDLRAQALQALSRVARSTGADVINFFFRVKYKADSEHSDYLQATILGSYSESFFRTDLTAMPLAIRLESFWTIGGFTSDYRVLGAELELVARAQVTGRRITTALMDLATVPGYETEWLRERLYDRPSSHFRVVRPQIAAAPLALRDLLMMARGLQLKTHRTSDSRRASAPNPPKKLLAPQFPPTGSRKDDHLLQSSNRIGLNKLLDPSGAQTTAAPDAGRWKSDLAAASRRMLYLLPGATEDQSFSGHLFGLREGTLCGWVRNELNPGEKVAVRVFRDGKLEKTVVANLNLETAAPLPAELRGHGFLIEVGASLAFLNRFQSGRIRLGVGNDGDITLGEATLGFRSLAEAGLEGCCDINRHGYLHGWVWRKGAPDDAVDVVVFVDGLVLARLTASSPREDLATASIGRGDHAFRLQIPKRLRDGTTRRITVFAAETGLPLNFGKLMLKGDLVTPI